MIGCKQSGVACTGLSELIRWRQQPNWLNHGGSNSAIASYTQSATPAFLAAALTSSNDKVGQPLLPAEHVPAGIYVVG
jgi:hypothetical protein